MNKIIIDNIEYKSISDACRTFGISLKTYYNRINKGKSPEEALTSGKMMSNSKEVVDHLGNKFETFKMMCDYYKIDRGTVHSRLKRGMSLEEALTSKLNKGEEFRGPDGKVYKYKDLVRLCEKYNKKVKLVKDRIGLGWTLEDALNKPVNSQEKYKDHNGKEYDSLSNLCKEYGITCNDYKIRVGYGWSLEKILTTPVNKIKRIEPIDYLGIRYNSLKDMCKHYNISISTFRGRMRSGYTVKEALTEKKGTRGNKCLDHLGNEYKSMIEMAKAYNISYKVLRTEIKKRKHINEVLLKRRETKKTVADHIGNIYNSFEHMCWHYGYSEGTIKKRIKEGFTLEQALTASHFNSNICKDHLGNIYKSVNEMCKAHGIKASTYYSRIKLGKTLEEALTCKRYKDHLGNEYTNINEMCKAYGIAEYTFRHRLGYKWNLKDSLTIPRLEHKISRAYVGLDNKQYYKIIINGIAIYLNCEQIIEMKDQGKF